MTDTTVRLAGVTFEGFEVPEEIKVRLRQRLNSHQLQGNARVIDAMGVSYDPLTWTGRFRGASAERRARAVEAILKAGKAVSLTFGALSYSVMLKEFEWSYQRAYEIPYSITCEVLADRAAPASVASDISATQMVRGDYATAATALVGIPTPKVSVLGAILSTVNDFATASRQVINGLVIPVANARAELADLIATTEGIAATTTLGGIVAGMTGVNMVNSLVAQAEAMQETADLYEADAYTARLQTNLGSIGTAGERIVVAGSDLYKAAVVAYGDAREWATIAAANSIIDPIIVGVQELTIPPTPTGTGGVLA